VGVIMVDNVGKKTEGGLRSKGEVKTSFAGKPLLSVITVVFNGERHLEQTIQSVIGQSYTNIEYIVIDGGSTDGTTGILNRYNDRIDYWISERDKGIYDAMNKGLDAARGDWIFFLGSDDVLYNRSAISDVATFLDKDMSLVFGNIMYNDGKIVKSRFNIITLLHNTVHHQSALYNASLFRNWRYDSKLRLIADYELNLRIYLEKLKYRHIDNIISICDQRGQSRNNLRLAFTETNIVRNKYIRGGLGIILSLLYFIKFRISSG
jgi:glycosyltransferase involved in cell wall biosynthesis